MSIKINTEEVKKIASNIDARRNEIEEIYKNKIVPMLKSSEDCLEVSGLSYDEVISSFDNLFNSLDSQLNGLTSDLTTKVIPKYENSSFVVNKMFNKEFADKMRETLTVINKK